MGLFDCIHLNESGECVCGRDFCRARFSAEHGFHACFCVENNLFGSVAEALCAYLIVAVATDGDGFAVATRSRHVLATQGIVNIGKCTHMPSPEKNVRSVIYIGDDTLVSD